MRGRSLLVLALLARIAFAAVPARAQPAPEFDAPPERLFGLTLERIEVRAAETENPSGLVALTGLAVGRPYSALALRSAVKTLHQLGRFENVYVSAARIGNGVSLEFVLPPRPRVREVRVIGDSGEIEVEEVLGLKAGGELDVRAFPEKREKLALAFRRIGYRSPAIGLAAEVVDASGSHDVVVRVDEGPRTRVSRVRIRGEAQRSDYAITSFLGVERGDELDLVRLERALEELARDYRARGHFEVSIGEVEVVDVAETIDGEPAAELVLPIDAGPKVSVRFQGHRVVSRRELEEAAGWFAEPGVGTSASAVAEVKERILARYERRGHYLAQVAAKTFASVDGRSKVIVFGIDEGPGSYVASVRFIESRRIEDGARQPLPGEPVFPIERLRAVVHQAVLDTLADELGAPGANPETVGQIVGDHSLADRPRDTPQPDTTSPDPERIYVPRAYRAAVDAIADMYRAEGFQTVEVQPPVVKRREDGTLLDVTIEIVPGVRWVLGAISFSGNEAIPSSELLALAKLEPGRAGGQPLSFYEIDEASRAIVGLYRSRGHLYARVSEDLREVPPRGSTLVRGWVRTSTSGPLDVQRVCQEAEAKGLPSCEVELVFRVGEGPEVRARNIILSGLETTRESLVRGEIVIREGEVLRESDMLATRGNLLRIGVFDRVAVHPVDEKNESAEKDVVAEFRERRHSAFEVGAGASTGEGVRVFAGYSHGNLFGTALKLQADAKVNVQPFLFLYNDSVRPQIEAFYSSFGVLQRIEREVAVGVSYPRIFGLPRGFASGLDLSIVRDNDPAFAVDTFGVTLSGTYTGFRPEILAKQRALSLQLRSNLDLTLFECNDFATTTATCLERRQGTSIYASIGPRLRFDFRDDPLDPHAGAYLEAATEFAKGLDTSSPDFLRVEGTLAIYLPLAPAVGLAFSLFAARLFELEDTTAPIPVNRKLFGGGASTIRGYPEGSLFPQDVAPPDARAISTGGLFLASLKNELRFPLRGALSGAVFYDIGDLYEDASALRISEDTRQGVGAGVRYATPVGPLSLDLAVPLVTRGDPGERRGLNIHFSVRSF